MTRTKGTYPWSSETQIVRDGQPSSDGDRSSESNDYHQYTHSFLIGVHLISLVVTVLLENAESDAHHKYTPQATIII
jgi:hypothetical protein